MMVYEADDGWSLRSLTCIIQASFQRDAQEMAQEMAQEISD